MPQVRVWEIPLAAGDGNLGECVSYLDPRERTRMSRFRTADLQRRFALSHGAARAILAAACNLQPAELTFRAGQWGKPELADLDLHFNLSHSGDRALLAVSADAPVGVDLERFPDTLPASALAGRFFLPAEAAAVASSPGPLQSRHYVRYWTRKEAAGKAAGLRMDQTLRLPVASDCDSFLLTLPPAAGDARAWVRDIPSVPGHLAAVAMLGPTPFDVRVTGWAPAGAEQPVREG